MKACELGSEVSWLPLTYVQKGVLCEGYMHNPTLTAKIETDLIQSKGCVFFDGTCYQHILKLVSLKYLCRDDNALLADWSIWGSKLTLY